MYQLEICPSKGFGHYLETEFSDLRLVLCRWITLFVLCRYLGGNMLILGSFGKQPTEFMIVNMCELDFQRGQSQVLTSSSSFMCGKNESLVNSISSFLSLMP